MNNEKEVEFFCKNLQNLRRKHNLSKKEMAKILDISIYSLTQLEKNILPPRLICSIFFKIQKNFGISPSNMLTRDFVKAQSGP